MRDNINRGGEKFGTEDIEMLIAQHPDIADGKVVAMPDPTYGEKACAFIIPRPGRRNVTVAELGSFLLARGLAKFKLPERIVQVDSFPVTRVGKLDRAALRSAIANTLVSESALKAKDMN
ncbi:AMP-binding enzyme, partial [Bradyrhizobium nitroreducens]